MPTQNTRTAAHRHELARNMGRPPMYEDPSELEAKFNDYFERQEREKRPLTIAGLCLAAGFSSRQTLHNYEERPEFMDVVKKARLRVEEYLSERLLSGAQGSAVGAIFTLKNIAPEFRKDRHETQITGAGGGPVEVAAGLAGMPPRPKSMEEWQTWYAQMQAESHNTVALEAAEAEG